MRAKITSKTTRSIFFPAFITGALMGASVYFGISADPHIYLAPTIQAVCPTNCGLLLFVSSWITLIVAALSLMYHVSKKRRWAVGLRIYALGWLIGFFVILSVVPMLLAYMQT